MPLTEPATDLARVTLVAVGLGQTGCHHLERLRRRDDCRVSGGYDENPAAVVKAAGLISQAYSSWRDVLADDRVDLVLLTTPLATRARLATEALLAGKHVLVEPPWCLSSAEAQQMIVAARQASRSLICAQPHRDDDDFLTALRCLESGAIGRVRAIKHLIWQYNRPHRSGAPDPRHADVIRPVTVERTVPPRASPALMGGVLGEFGTSSFDQLLRMTREPAEAVYARLYQADDGGGVEAGFLAIVQFRSGLIAQIEYSSAFTAPLSIGWAVAGDRGSYAEYTQYTTTADGEIVDEPLPPVSVNPDDFYQSLVQHLRLGAANRGPPEEARQALALVEAARRSTISGQPEPVIPADFESNVPVPPIAPILKSPGN